jgi:hypothetical protein
MSCFRSSSTILGGKFRPCLNKSPDDRTQQSLQMTSWRLTRVFHQLKTSMRVSPITSYSSPTSRHYRRRIRSYSASFARWCQNGSGRTRVLRGT